MARIDAAQGAALLGISAASWKRYKSLYAPGGMLPTFPPPDANGLWLPSALIRWDKARPGGKGVPRPKSPDGYPCQVCGALVKRRIVDEVDGLRKCRPCWAAGDPGLVGEGSTG
jgi:hypothetical protein